MSDDAKFFQSIPPDLVTFAHGLHDKLKLAPLYEGKMIHQFDHRWAGYSGTNLRDIEAQEKRDQYFEPSPQYWVLREEVNARLDGVDWQREWLFGWRDITSAHVYRTAIACIFPRVASNNKLPLMFPHVEPIFCAALLGNINALTFDFVARQKIGGNNLPLYALCQLPVLRPDFYSAQRLEFVAMRTLELTYTSHSLAPFARDLGYEGPPFTWDEDRRAHLRADLDAFYARAYGLTRDELRYILDPADVMGPDYPSETFRVLKEKEIRQFDEYRTRRLVLSAWDRMEADGTFKSMDM
jgi:hypothetical protein